MKKQFRSAWDSLLIIMTILVSAALITVAFFGGTVSVIFAILFITLGAFFGVYGYSLHEKELRIIRLGWSSDIAYSDIVDIEYSPDAMMGSLRKFGIGGFFSYYGLFRNRVIGNYKAYATHRKNTVVITTRSGKKIVVTPDDPRRFADELKKYQSAGNPH
jgi:hypothetical protein